ncbi:MAG: C39 family peptidase [Clostridia bacterium]|nr:C39 family peptidase [Clostridia bacterium]
MGFGRQEVSENKGYFTTFTTETLNNKKTYKEFKQNGDVPWKNNPYWEGTMESDGCLITAMSIILSGYEKNYTPEDLRQVYYPHLSADKISYELSNYFGVKNTDFYFDSIHLSNEYIEEYLKTNRPILICVWNKPNTNRWTEVSHYMVLLAGDDNHKVYVSNPNGLEDTHKASGWYDINEISPYIAKALFIEEY